MEIGVEDGWKSDQLLQQYGQACNSRAGNTEASVICRQLGCVGANGTGQKVDPTR